MKNFKPIIVVIIAFLSIVNTYGQCALIDKTAYIFEAKEVSHELFLDSKNKATHNAIKLLITAIYKNGDGRLKLGTIEMIDDMPPYYIDPRDGSINIMKNDGVHPGKDGVYLCRRYGSSSSHPIATDNDTLCLEQGFVVDFMLYPGGNNQSKTHPNIFRAFGKSYENKEDFYRDLSQCPNIAIPDSLTQKKSPNERRMKDWHRGITRFYDTLQYYIDTLSSNWNYEQYLENFNGYTQDILLELGNDILPFTEPSRGSCRDLFISEYVCGTGSNQSIELFNPTSSSISLSHYYLKIFPNGSASLLTITLSGSVPSHNTYIISNFII